MNDHDRQRFHGPLQDPAPDCWHDRPTGISGWVLAFVTGAIIAAIILWMLPAVPV